MPSLFLACALAVASLAACSGAAPATATAPTAASPQSSQPLCDAACWQQLGLFLAETCRCSTEACANQARERMISWVTAEVVEAKRLDALQQEVDLPRELEAYDAVDDACTARLRPPASPTRRRAFVDGRVASGPRAARAIRSSSR